MKNRKLKIAFDANPLVQENLTGIGNYEKRLIESLAKYSENTELIGYYYDFLGMKKPKNLPKSSNIKYKKILLYPGKLVNLLRRIDIEIPVELLIKSKCDIALFPNYISQPSLFGAKIYPFIHDLTHIYFPEYMAEKNKNDLLKLLPITIKRAAGIITISESTKNQIIKEYDIKKDILVTPIPYEKVFTKIDKHKIPDFISNNKYILFVGTLEPRKNIIGLVSAYISNPKLNKEYSLILCGGVDWKADKIISVINKAKNEGFDVIDTGYVDEITKAYLYKNCSCVVMASYYEGFGMPILEALSYMKPIALSDIEVFREVAGKSAYYFNNNSSKSISETILKSVQIKRNTIKPPYSSYTWLNITNEILNFIKRDLNKL